MDDFCLPENEDYLADNYAGFGKYIGIHEQQSFIKYPELVLSLSEKSTLKKFYPLQQSLLPDCYICEEKDFDDDMLCFKKFHSQIHSLASIPGSEIRAVSSSHKKNDQASASANTAEKVNNSVLHDLCSSSDGCESLDITRDNDSESKNSQHSFIDEVLAADIDVTALRSQSTDVAQRTETTDATNVSKTTGDDDLSKCLHDFASYLNYLRSIRKQKAKRKFV